MSLVNKSGGIKAAFLSSLIFLISGCMVPPNLGPKAKPRGDLIAYKGKNDIAITYPEYDWWREYRDPQLIALIEKGLVNSPSITEAMARAQNPQSPTI